jgi:hypothetical protein
MSKTLLKKQLAALHQRTSDAPAPARGGVSKHAGDRERAKLERAAKKAVEASGKRQARRKDEIVQANLAFFSATTATQEATQELMNKVRAQWDQ